MAGLKGISDVLNNTRINVAEAKNVRWLVGVIPTFWAKYIDTWG